MTNPNFNHISKTTKGLLVYLSTASHLASFNIQPMLHCTAEKADGILNSRERRTARQITPTMLVPYGRTIPSPRGHVYTAGFFFFLNLNCVLYQLRAAIFLSEQRFPDRLINVAFGYFSRTKAFTAASQPYTTQVIMS